MIFFQHLQNKMLTFLLNFNFANVWETNVKASIILRI